MRKFTFVTIGLLLAGLGYLACTHPATPPEKGIAQKLLTQVDSFALMCKALQTAAGTPGQDVPAPRLQQLFLQCRRSYKRIEWAAEYFDPLAALSVNGPPVREVEFSGAVVSPTGLQMIEPLLFPSFDTTKRKDIEHQVDIILAACERYRSHFTNVDILDWQVFDAAKLEVFRVMTLGITGFDNPLTLQSSTESAAALQSLQAVLANYPDANAKKSATPASALSTTSSAASTSSAPPTSTAAARIPPTPTVASSLDAAVQYLTTHPDFNTLDRAAFITTCANPLSTAISDQETALNIHIIRYNRLLNQDAKTLFEPGAFNINAYSPTQASFSSPAKVALGQKLFTDPSLSFTGTRSCQSCHQPGKAFSDGLVKNTVLVGKGMLPRNTPTLINAALQPAQFYDMRVATLEDQSRTVVQNNAEMHGDMKLSVQRLWQDTTYRRLFSTAFPQNNRTTIDTLEIMNALGSYVRSLVSLTSRFDDYMRGDHSALNANEVSGFNLFMGKARCGTCHYMPVFNGAFPPRFVKVDAEIIGVPQTVAAIIKRSAGYERGGGDPRNEGPERDEAWRSSFGEVRSSSNEVLLDPDPGRYAIIPDTSFQHAFKTPTLRNAARTAPYMHNGVFATLEEVIDFYDKGGGAGLGLNVPNQTLPFDKLGLTSQQKNDLIAFIKSLDSR